MKKMLVLFIVVILSIGLLCYFQIHRNKPNIYPLNVDGHTYLFKYNPKDVLKVECNNPEGIQIKTFQAKRIVILFNGSSPKDNSLFAVIGQNIVLKLKPYFEFQGIKKNYTAYEITNYTPTEGDLKIVLIGPRTGANGTYVLLTNETVFISGNTTDNAQMAGERFVLSVFGITN